jgi:carbamoyl-phosphate synthase small subunit
MTETPIPLPADAEPAPVADAAPVEVDLDRAVLVLEDGSRYEGRAYGARGRTFGEAVFATGMTGYQETLSDPSYAGQIVLMTAPHIGNTGMNDEDMESAKIWVAGFVVRDPSRVVSNFRSQAHRHAGGPAPHPFPRRHARRRVLR